MSLFLVFANAHGHAVPRAARAGAPAFLWWDAAHEVRFVAYRGAGGGPDAPYTVEHEVFTPHAQRPGSLCEMLMLWQLDGRARLASATDESVGWADLPIEVASAGADPAKTRRITPLGFSHTAGPQDHTAMLQHAARVSEALDAAFVTMRTNIAAAARLKARADAELWRLRTVPMAEPALKHRARKNGAKRARHSDAGY